MKCLFLYHSLLLLLLLLLTALQTRSATAFALLQYVPSPRSLLLRIHNSSKKSALDKDNTDTEKKAIQRFTTDYDELCKTCPTRLQPGVDTLTEMIMGMSTQDRNELLEAVAKRVQQQQQREEEEEKAANESLSSSQQEQKSNVGGWRTAKEFYDFQVAGSINSSSTKTSRSSSSLFQIRTVLQSKQKLKLERKQIDKRDVAKSVYDKRHRKALAKMEEAKLKLRENDAKLVKIEGLVQATTWLLSNSAESINNNNNKAWQSSVLDVNDNNNIIIDNDMAKLRSMTRSQLKLQLLRLTEDKAKCERSRAKCRAKRYAASLELARQER